MKYPEPIKKDYESLYKIVEVKGGYLVLNHLNEEVAEYAHFKEALACMKAKCEGKR